jgi:branched-chain amino acid transport system substrate-binding protein
VTDDPRRVRPLLALALGPVLASALACGGSPIRYGAILPLSGQHEVYGQAIRKGIELAYQQAKADPAFAELELSFHDSASDPQRANAELRKVYDEGALAAIGGVTSAEALAMVKIADDEGRVLLSPSASLPQLTGISENFFRVFPSDFSEGTVMARYAFENLRLRAGVVIAQEETYAMGIQKVFAEEFQRKGGRILETIDYPANTSEFEALADRAVTLRPDFAYVAAYAAEISRIIRDLRGQGFAGLILTTSSFAAAGIIEQTGATAEGAYFTQATFDTEGEKLTPQVKSFVEAFQQRFATAPDLYAAHGFDAFNVLLEAYRQGGTTTNSFWKGMRGIRDLQGVTGVLQFDEKGDVTKFPHVYIVTQGKPVDVEERRQEEILRARQEIERIQREMERLRGAGDN